MKFCSHCGKELPNENAIACPNCGCAISGCASRATGSVGSSATKVLAKIFLILSCIFTGLFILPLAWKLPITIVACRAMDRGEKIDVRLKVCALFFVGLLPGIIMLCDNEI